MHFRYAPLLVLVFLPHFAQAADPAPTTITLQELHCAGCVKKVTVKLLAVPGVAKVEADQKTATVKVAPKPDAAPSPRALWEAVENAGQIPVKLQGPGGTYTALPPS